MQATYTLSMQDIDAYLASKADEEIIGITCHATECLLARVARWKFGEPVALYLRTFHLAGRQISLEAELEYLYHLFDALNRGEIERPVSKREWLEACAGDPS